MSFLRQVLERLGFARLRDYGLLLTPDGRVMTTRTRILDDGYGGRVVGWMDGDLAAMELHTWVEPRDAAPAARPPLPRAPLPPAPPPAAPQPPSPPPPAPVLSVVAAPPPAEPEEDDWEWEIAVARARAAADEPPAAAPPPVAAVPARKWLTTEPLSDWGEDTKIRPVPQPRGSAQMEAVTPGRTVIPVPSLPTCDPELVRSHHAAQLRQAPRLARASEPPSMKRGDFNAKTRVVHSFPARQRANGG